MSELPKEDDGVNPERPPAVEEAKAQPDRPVEPTSAKTFLAVSLLCVGFAVLTDFLFYRQPVGWTLGGYALLLMAAIFIWERKLPRGKAALIAAALALLCLGCLEEPNSLMLLLGLFGLASLALALRQGWTGSGVVWLERWIGFAALGWLSLFEDAHRCSEARQAIKGWAAERTVSVIRHWFIPTMLSLVFLALFALANPIIQDWLNSLWQTVTYASDELPAGERVLLWLIVALVVWALLRFRLDPSDGSQEASSEVTTESVAWLSVGVVVRCLVIFNALFLVQTVLDVRYLWGGARLPSGMTYASYAHRGAYPLVAAAILAAFFMLITFQAGSQSESFSWARRLVHLWLAQNVFLVFSAFWRLYLYILAYSLTRWRVAAAIWILLVAGGLTLIFWRIVTRRADIWLINANAVTALFVLYVCSFLNFDGFIADFNVRHCREMGGKGVHIDLPYLARLGPDTLPALLRLAAKHPKMPGIQETIEQLRTELQESLQDWRSWTYRRHRMMQLDFPKARAHNQADPSQRSIKLAPKTGAARLAAMD